MNIELCYLIKPEDRKRLEEIKSSQGKKESHKNMNEFTLNDYAELLSTDLGAGR